MAKQTDYKALMTELTALLGDMQAGDIAVDEALQKYARGQALISELQDYLEKAENTITTRKAE